MVARKNHYLPTPVLYANAAQRDKLIVTWHNHGLSYREIARRLGIRHGAVAAALERIAQGRPGRMRER